MKVVTVLSRKLIHLFYDQIYATKITNLRLSKIIILSAESTAHGAKQTVDAKQCSMRPFQAFEPCCSQNDVFIPKCLNVYFLYNATSEFILL